MEKISWAGLNQQVYDIVNKIGEEYLEVMKDNLVNGRRSVQLSRKIFREAGLDHREYTPHYRTILEHTVMNVFYNKLGERQIPLSKVHRDMIGTNGPLPKHDETELDALFGVPNVKFGNGTGLKINLVGLKADLLIIDDLEKPMSLFITRPLLVGNINILTASKEQLALIIREAQSQIEANADLTKVSVNYQQKQVELEEVITLCVEQLDKGIKAKLVEKKAFK